MEFAPNLPGYGISHLLQDWPPTHGYCTVCMLSLLEHSMLEALLYYTRIFARTQCIANISLTSSTLVITFVRKIDTRVDEWISPFQIGE